MMKWYSIIILFFTIATLAVAQPIWEPTNGPYGGDINAITRAEDGRLFAGTFLGGLYLSNDSGLTWSYQNFRGEPINALAISFDAQVLVGTQSHGLLYQPNGREWVNMIGSLTYQNVSGIAVNQDNGTIYILAGDQYMISFSVYQSTDFGVTWTAISQGLSNAYYFQGLSIAPNGDLYGGGFGEIYRRANNGSTWTTQRLTPASATIDCFAFQGTSIYAGGTRVFASTNNGTSWVERDTITGRPMVYALSVTPSNELYAATNRGVHRKLATTGWSGSLTDHGFYALYAQNAGWMVAGSRADGIFRSINGNTWTMSPGITANSPFTIEYRGTNGLYLGATNGVFRSTNDGGSWARISSPTKDINCFDAAGSGTLYAGFSYDGLYQSADNGTSWTRAGLVDSNLTFVVTAPMGNLYASTGRTILRSSNGGTSWTTFTNTVSSVYTIYVVPSLIPESWGLLIGTNAGIYSCLEDGRNWAFSGLQTVAAYQITMNGEMNLFAATSQGVFRSTNGGQSWSQTPFHQASTRIVGTQEGVLFFNSDSGVYRSADNCATWSLMNQGLSSHGISTMCITPTGRLFAGIIGEPVYRTQGSAVGVPEPALTELPTRAILRPNYPNPFNSTTMISYDLPQASITQLEIFNANGQLVTTLHAGMQTAGTHEIAWHATNLSSGIYWSKLTVGSNSYSRKVLLLK